MLVAVPLEEEVGDAILGNISDLSLRIVLARIIKSCDGVTNQVDDASGVSLVLSALGEEEQALAGLAGPGSGGVGSAQLLVLEVLAELLDLDGVVGEPEVALGETEAPGNGISTVHRTCIASTHLTRPGAL